MFKEENQSTSLRLSADSFPPTAVLNIDTGGAFFKDLAYLLKLHRFYQIKRLHNIENIHLSNSESAYVINFRQNELIFKKGFQDLLGFSDREISLDFIRQLYHPDDYEIIDRLYKTAILYCLNNPSNCEGATLLVSFRIRNKKGNYIKILSKSTVFERDQMGRIISVLVKLTDISFIDKTNNVNWKFNSDDATKKLFKQQVYKAYQNFFTKRETDIIFEIEKGKSSRQIAQSLSISEFTVATHRKNIFKKAGCHHTEELIIFCKGKGIL